MVLLQRISEGGIWFIIFLGYVNWRLILLIPLKFLSLSNWSIQTSCQCTFSLWYGETDFRLPLSVVLESVTTILHPRTPEWLRTVLTRKLSSVLLEAERHGVGAVVLFFLGKYQEPTTTDLQRIAEVVGSIPSWLTPEVPHT